MIFKLIATISIYSRYFFLTFKMARLIITGTLIKFWPIESVKLKKKKKKKNRSNL